MSEYKVTGICCSGQFYTCFRVQAIGNTNNYGEFSCYSDPPPVGTVLDIQNFGLSTCGVYWDGVRIGPGKVEDADEDPIPSGSTRNPMSSYEESRKEADAVTDEEAAARPMQQVVWAGDVIRFRENKIVRMLLDEGPFDMNAIAMRDFSQEDREQFAQLIGYSVSGAGDLSYMSAAMIARADIEAEKRTMKGKLE